MAVYRKENMFFAGCAIRGEKRYLAKQSFHAGKQFSFLQERQNI